MNLKTLKTRALAGMMLATITGARAETALNPETVLAFSISKEGLTRISIRDDGIEDIYAYPTAYADNIIYHPSGHAFVAGEGLEGPFYVTLITRQGIAQDLKLIPKAKEAEPILLSLGPPRLEQARLGQTRLGQARSGQTGFGGAPTLPLRDVYARILGQFAQGIVPEGFVPVPANEATRSAEDVEAILEVAWQSGNYRILAFTVHNESNNRIALDHPKIHEALWGKGDLASCFYRPVLNPRKSAKLYVIQPVTEEEAS